MADLNLPNSAKEVKERMRTDVQNALPVSNPFLPASLLNALITGFSGRIYDFYLQLEAAINQAFPDTATGDYLKRWGAWVNIYPTPETKAQGNITCTGVLGSAIPVNTAFQSSTGNQYNSTVESEIIDYVIDIISLSRIGSLVTATTVSNHNFASGQIVTMSGALQSEYNGDFLVTVISPDEFQYTIIGTPLSPATGTILASATMGIVNVLSVNYGLAQNLPSGATLTPLSPIDGVNSNALVEYFGIGGGADTQSDPSYRETIQFRYQNPVSLFNPTAIELQAKTVSGVTRVWVYPITPAIGEVTIYFTRDNDPSPIPGPDQVLDVYNAILEIKDAVTVPEFVHVFAPDPITVDFSFSELIPNTATMRESITASLEAYFQDSTNVGVNLTENAYKCAIFSTIDLTTGESVQSFTLSTPTGDIIVEPGELAVLGNVTYP